MVWLFQEAEKGQSIYGYCMEDHYTPYMKGQAFRYAEANKLLITDIQYRDGYDFLIISR